MKRKLVAILAGDVAGYSRLMGENEDLAVQNWTAYREYILDVASDHQGRLFNSAGDSLIFAFSSVLDALRAAVEIQQFLRDVNEGVPPQRQMLMRFGLHLGDLVVDERNYLGDGVNIAARVESQATPGGICVSEMVYSNVAASPEFSFEPMGEVALKNIARPLRIYRVALNGAGQGGGAIAGAAAPLPEERGIRVDAGSDHPAVAVLPFDNLGEDSDEDYFVDGLTEDIITLLAAWRSFPVIARNSTFAYKGKSPDIRAVASDLGARYVLEGSVRRVGSKVRVNVQFLDAENGHHLWAEKFDREIEDVFELQDEIAHHIAATVAPELERAERHRSAELRPKDMTAWSLCLKGRALLERFRKEDNDAAREFFEQAIELDPGYSAAYAGLAYSYHRDLWFEAADSRESAIRAMVAAAQRAVALDRANSEAHCLLGFAFIWERKYHLAIASGQQAVSINPSNALAFAQLGIALSFAGRPREGIPQLQRSLALNPQDPRIHFVITMIARAYLNARDPETAAHWAERAVQRQFGYPLAHLVRSAALGQLGHAEQARAALEECERCEAGFATRWALRPMYKDPNDDLYFLEGLRKAGLETEQFLGV